MNKKEVYSYYKELVESFKNGKISELEKALTIVSPVAEMIKNEATDMVSESSLGQQTRRQISTTIREAIVKEKQINYRQIVVEIYNLEEFLKKLLLALDGDNCQFINDLLDGITSFMDKYDNHNRSYNENSFIPVAISALELKILLNTTFHMAQSLHSIPSEEYNENYKSVELYLSNVTSLKEFSRKLSALYDIYIEMLHLYGVSESDYPIVIEHIENGSLWVKIAGHSLTVTALSIVMTSATTYYQDNFTVSGKINQLPASVKVLNELFSITKTLEKDGIDTTEIEDHIVSSTKKIANRLDDLLSDQPLVEINDKKIFLSNGNTQKLLEAKVKHLPFNDS